MRGHITKRSKNSWTIVIPLGRDSVTRKPKQHWESVRGPKREAEKRLAELVHQLDTEAFVKPSKASFGEFLNRWARDYVAMNVRPRTAEGYAHKIERHILPALGEIPLNELQPAHLQEFYRRALTTGRLDGNGGLSARSVLHLHRIISEALNHAVKWGLVYRNIAQAVDPPRPRRQEMKTLDAAGVEHLLEAARSTPYYPLIHMAIFTGLRRSELLGLRWKDVDLMLGTVSVVQVMHSLRGGKIVFQEPKSAKGRRQVALSPASVLTLKAHRERQEADRIITGGRRTADDLVFSQPDGALMLPNTVTHAFIKIMRRAGLKGIRFHDLRHTHASLMLAQGVHPKIVSERLGHATVSITLDTYSHVTPGLQEAAALRFEEGLARTPLEEVARVPQEVAY